MDEQKPELLTRSDIFMDYYFTVLIQEQQRTNELLEKLLQDKGITITEQEPKPFWKRVFGK